MFVKATIVISLIFFPLTGNSQAILNFGKWRSLSSVSKTVYVSGLVDTILDPICIKCEQRSFAKAIKLCIADLAITNMQLVSMIEELYADKRFWELSPQSALKVKLVEGYCARYIEKFTTHE